MRTAARREGPPGRAGEGQARQHLQGGLLGAPPRTPQKGIGRMLCPVLGPSLQERHGGPGVCSEKGSQAVRGLEHRCYGDWLREMGLFKSGKEKSQGRPHHSLQLPEGRICVCVLGGEVGLCSCITSDSTGGNGLKLRLGGGRCVQDVCQEKFLLQEWSGSGVTVPGGVKKHSDVVPRDVGQREILVAGGYPTQAASPPCAQRGAPVLQAVLRGLCKDPAVLLFPSVSFLEELCTAGPSIPLLTKEVKREPCPSGVLPAGVSAEAERLHYPPAALPARSSRCCTSEAARGSAPGSRAVFSSRPITVPPLGQLRAASCQRPPRSAPRTRRSRSRERGAALLLAARRLCHGRGTAGAALLNGEAQLRIRLH